MTVNPVSLNQTMRPAEIAVINAVNDLITEVNALDVSTINQRLNSIDSSITNINNRLDAIDGANGSIATIQATLTTIQTDVTAIKATLYTPLNQNVPDPS